jgi:hypothetical protein
MQLSSRIDADGVLRVTLPLGQSEANREVLLTIVPAASPPMTQEEWRTWVMANAGCISDPTFRRHEQGEFEEREALP